MSCLSEKGEPKPLEEMTHTDHDRCNRPASAKGPIKMAAIVLI